MCLYATQNVRPKAIGESDSFVSYCDRTYQLPRRYENKEVDKSGSAVWITHTDLIRFLLISRLFIWRS